MGQTRLQPHFQMKHSFFEEDFFQQEEYPLFVEDFLQRSSQYTVQEKQTL